MLALVTAVQAFLANPHVPARWARTRHPTGRESGQATAEYALVLLAAATIAVVLLAWATKSGAIEKLFDAVFNALMSKIT